MKCHFKKNDGLYITDGPNVRVPDGALPITAEEAAILTAPSAAQLEAQAKAAQDAADAQDARDDALVQAVAAMTPAQLVAHIDTTFPAMDVQQRRVLKVLAKMARLNAVERLG